MDVQALNEQNVTDPQMPQWASFVPALTGAHYDNGEMLKTPTQVNPTGDAVTAAQVGTTAQAAQQVNPGAATYDATQVSGQTPQATAQQGTINQNDLVQAAQGTMSDAYKGTMDQAAADINATQVDPNSTVQQQYKNLMSGDMAWATGAITKANQLMAARGLGSSTMAGEAVTGAILQAALPIAQQDAAVFQALQQKKLDQTQQLTLTKASYLANLDTQNLSNRQQAAVTNAQAFLGMDLKNLDERQQTEALNTQARVQTLLSDQSADNAAKQFNASSTDQVNQFFASLSGQIGMYNTGQTNAMAQFNTGQTNTVAQFNANLSSQREQFNVQNQLLVDQSNAQYLRQINLQNTANQNQANYVNSQNLMQVSNTAMANEIQLMRDSNSYVFTGSQNADNRAANQALLAMQQSASFKMLDQQQQTALAQTMGKFASNALGSALDNPDSLKTIASWF